MAAAGCSSEGGSDWLNLLRAARSNWEDREASVRLDEAAAIPYSTIGVRVDDGQEQMLILAVDNNGERLWLASSKVAITTRRGRIIRTSGFGTDLSGYYITSAKDEDWNRPHLYTFAADFADLRRYSAVVTCQDNPRGPDPIEILGKQIMTVRIEEICNSADLDWSFTNTFWVSAASGRVWRSIQHIHPKGPSIELELLRPPLSQG